MLAAGQAYAYRNAAHRDQRDDSAVQVDAVTDTQGPQWSPQLTGGNTGNTATPSPLGVSALSGHCSPRVPCVL
jgi:hypothetical protein